MAGVMQDAARKLDRLIRKDRELGRSKAVRLQIDKRANGGFPVEKIGSKKHARQSSGSACGSNSQTDTMGKSFENSRYKRPIAANVAVVIEISTQVGA